MPSGLGMGAGGAKTRNDTKKLTRRHQTARHGKKGNGTARDTTNGMGRPGHDRTHHVPATTAHHKHENVTTHDFPVTTAHTMLRPRPHTRRSQARPHTRRHNQDCIHDAKTTTAHTTSSPRPRTTSTKTRPRPQRDTCMTYVCVYVCMYICVYVQNVRTRQTKQAKVIITNKQKQIINNRKISNGKMKQNQANKQTESKYIALTSWPSTRVRKPVPDVPV